MTTVNLTELALPFLAAAVGGAVGGAVGNIRNHQPVWPCTVDGAIVGFFDVVSTAAAFYFLWKMIPH